MSFINNIKSLWIIIILLILVNVITVSTIWISKDRRPNWRPDREIVQPVRQHFLKGALEFTAEQEVIFDSLSEQHRTRLADLGNEIKSLREELVNKMRNQEFDVESEQLIRQIGERQAELEMVNFRNFKAVLELCNDEQKEQFLNMMQRAFRPHNDRHDGDLPYRGRRRR